MSDEILLNQPELTLGSVRPVISEEVGIKPPENGEIRKIAEDVLKSAMYTFVAVAANPAANLPPNSLESAFRDVLQSMKEERRANFQSKAKEMVQLPKSARQAIFGRYGVMDTEDMLAKGFAKADTGLPALEINRKLLGVPTPTIVIRDPSKLEVTDRGLVIPREHLPSEFENYTQDWEAASTESVLAGVVSEHLNAIWGSVNKTDPYAASMTDFENFEEQAVLDKLAFYITEVKCEDETSPEWWGSDEIAIAGVSVDEDGDTKKIAETYVGGGFDDGDVKRYSPNWRYEWFSMREGNTWPKRYCMTLLLAEKDEGGFSSVLNTIWNNIRDKVKQLIAEAIGAILTEYLGPAIARAIGQAVAWVIDKLIGWIIDAFKDDVFPPMVRSITVPSIYARWYYSNGTWGSPVSPVSRVHTYGHGGHYSIQYYWRMFS